MNTSRLTYVGKLASVASFESTKHDENDFWRDSIIVRFIRDVGTPVVERSEHDGINS